MVLASALPSSGATATSSVSTPYAEATAPANSLARLAASAASASRPVMVLHSVAAGFCAQRVRRPVSAFAACVSFRTTSRLAVAVAARSDTGRMPTLLVFAVSSAARWFTRTCAERRVCTSGTSTPKVMRRVIPYSSANGVVTMRASLRTSSRPKVNRWFGVRVSVCIAPSIGASRGSCRGPSESVDSSSPSPRTVPFSPKRLS